MTVSVAYYPGDALARLDNMIQRAGNVGQVMEKFAQRTMRNSITKNFLEGGRPQKWDPVDRYGSSAKALMDTGRLRDSFAPVITENSVQLMFKAVQWRLQNYGGTVLPKKGTYLAIPVYPALSISQIQAGVGPRSFTDLEFKLHGPEGCGLYRRRFAKVKGQAAEWVLVFRLVKKAVIKKREFAIFQPEDKVELRRQLLEYIFNRKVA